MEDPELIREMQELVMRGEGVASVLQLAADRLGPAAPIPMIANLMAAFGLTIPVAKHLVGWRGFSRGGLSDDAVEEIAGGALRAWREARETKA